MAGSYPRHRQHAAIIAAFIEALKRDDAHALEKTVTDYAFDGEFADCAKGLSVAAKRCKPSAPFDLPDERVGIEWSCGGKPTYETFLYFVSDKIANVRARGAKDEDIGSYPIAPIQIRSPLPSQPRLPHRLPNGFSSSAG